MRKLYGIAVVLVLFGGLGYGFMTRNEGIDVTAPEYAYMPMYKKTRLSNGTVVHELTDDPAEAFGDIEPAAGDEADTGGSVHYDPLTQTHRRETVDSDGNTRQEIIRDPN